MSISKCIYARFCQHIHSVERWAYVQEHNVQLPDEYDQIYRDLEPFWGMNPTDLQRIQRGWEAHVDSFTVGKDTFDEPISLKNHTFDDIGPNSLAKGAYELMDLLEEVQDSIPPFHAVFSPHDNPNLLTDRVFKNAAIRAAKEGTCKHRFVHCVWTYQN